MHLTPTFSPGKDDRLTWWRDVLAVVVREAEDLGDDEALLHAAVVVLQAGLRQGEQQRPGAEIDALCERLDWDSS